MIGLLPEGNSIGWMQAPPAWIFSHTARFVGIVRIVIEDGEGFILIQRGNPIYYYFKHGRIELNGNSALDYFNSHPIIEFNLCKYSADEFAEAMKICNIIDESSNEQTESEPLKIVLQAPVTAPITPVAEPDFPSVTSEEKNQVLQFIPYEENHEESTSVTLPDLLDENDIRLIGQIKKLNGIVAISVFNDEKNILMMGDVDNDPLLKIARSMLATTRKISPLVEWGSFVHMTLQVPDGNVIIAPYHDYYLCLLTTRTINIGHIRRILRDLQPITTERE